MSKSSSGPSLRDSGGKDAGGPPLQDASEQDSGKPSLWELRALFGRTIRRHLPPLPEAPRSAPPPPQPVGTHARLLPLLKGVPWLLGMLFCVSFLWDFPGQVLSLGGFRLQLDGLLRVLSMSGLIGFLTNWLAITMLFHPRSRRPLLGQGLIPAQRKRVIYRLARAVSEELINEKIIQAKIQESGLLRKYRDLSLTVTRGVIEDPTFRRELKTFTVAYIDEALASDQVRERMMTFMEERIQALAGSGWVGLALRTYRFWNEEDFKRRLEEAVHEVPASLDTVLDEIDRLLDRLPEKIEARSEDIEAWSTRLVLAFVGQLDIYGMIASNMERYDERKLETLIKSTANEQLNYIKYLGGVIGTAGGLVIWRPFLALGLFVVVGSLALGLDTLLRKQRGSR